MQRVGKIHFALGRRRRAADDVVDVGIDDVAADDGVVGKFVFDGGLFHDLFDLIAALAHLFRLDVGVLCNVAVGNFHHRDGGLARLFKAVDQLLYAWHSTLVGIDDVVAEQNGEGFVARERLRVQDGVCKPDGVLLPDKIHIGEVFHLARDGQKLLFAVVFEQCVQFGRIIEKVFQYLFVAAGDDQDVFDARRNGLFHDILQRRFIDDGQHLFADRFGDGQEARAEACRGDDCLADFFCLHTVFLL